MYPEKISRSKREKQQQTQPTYGVCREQIKIICLFRGISRFVRLLSQFKVDLCFRRNKRYLLKTISISCQVHSPLRHQIFPVPFQCAQIKYINEGEAKLAFSCSKHNFLTTPSLPVSLQ